MLSEVTSQCGSTCLGSGKSQDTHLGIVGRHRILEVPPGEGEWEGYDGGDGREGREARDDSDGWRITLCEIQGVLRRRRQRLSSERQIFPFFFSLRRGRWGH